jgi:signal transduction histidine kinase
MASGSHPSTTLARNPRRVITRTGDAVDCGGQVDSLGSEKATVNHVGRHDMADATGKSPRWPAVAWAWLASLLTTACLAEETDPLVQGPQPDSAAKSQAFPESVSRPIGPRTAKSQHDWDPATWGVGAYIWSAKTADKQTCRLWQAFEIPRTARVTNAKLRVLADNGFVVFLDGRELGMGSDYYYMTEYDISQVLTPGRHVIAIRAFNESHQAGVVAGLRVVLKGSRPIVVVSDTTWRLAPDSERNWEQRAEAPANWAHAVEVAPFGSMPWIDPPLRLNRVLVQPPEVPAFWKRGWFQAVVAAIGGAAALASLVLATRLVAESKARVLLDRERARIARDIHDEMGAGLTQLVLEGEVTRTELPIGSAARERLEAFCNRARGLAGALDELVWAVNSRRDTLRDFVAYTSKHIRRFLEPTSIRCRLEVADDLPDLACDLPVRRNLLLAVKEAVNNAVKYSGADQLCFRVQRRPPMLVVAVEDDGRGFDLEEAKAAGNGLANLVERMHDIGGVCRITTAPGAGCRVELEVPLARFARRSGPPAGGADLLTNGRGAPAPGGDPSQEASAS